MELGDRITLHHGCPCGLKDDWVTVEGRVNDMLPFVGDNGRIVPCASMCLLIILDEYNKEGLEHFRDYQLVLHQPNRLEVRLDCFDPAEKEENFAKVKSLLSDYLQSLGIKELHFELAEKLPENTTASGKRRKIYLAKD